ncbi:MAG: hypothetical protein AAF515_09105 [Pseudomonadota bacterium]
MSDDDWYRSSIWNEDIEKRFLEKLAGARSQRHHYLAVQANAISKSNPNVAMRLLDMESPDWNVGLRASIMLEAGRYSEAIRYFHEALIESTKHPNTVENTAFIFALAVIEHQITSEFANANEALDQCKEDLRWPLEKFQWYAAKARLLNCATHATHALDLSEVRKSGFVKHPGLGLVGSDQAKTIDKLKCIVANPSRASDIENQLKRWKGKAQIPAKVHPRRRLERQRAIANRVAAAKPAIAELRKIGLAVDNIAQLADAKSVPAEAISILLRHFDKEPIQKEILRVLECVQPNTEVTRCLLDRYTEEPRGSGLKTLLSAFLHDFAHPAFADAITAIASNPSHGESRIRLACSLTRMLNEDDAYKILRPFILSDQMPWDWENDISPIAATVIEALGNARLVKARDDIAPWVDHDDSYTRDKAKRAVGKIDTAIRRLAKKNT